MKRETLRELVLGALVLYGAVATFVLFIIVIGQY